jgi:RNA recognition motif-containing protein
LHAAQTAAARALSERRKLKGGDNTQQNHTSPAAPSPDGEFIERDDDCSVFIGNLPPTIDYKGLVSAVHAVILPENIVKIKLCKDQEGIPRGFGYVQLAHTDLVDQAIAILKGHELKGRKLRADYADKEKRFRQSARAEQWAAQQAEDGEFDSDEEGYAAERRRSRRGAGPVGLPQRGKVGLLSAGDGPGGKAGTMVTPWNRQAAAADGGAGEFRWGFRSAPRSSSSRLDPSRPLPEATLFVGNLAFDVTDAMLAREIEKFVGPDQVASVRVICDRNTGYSKGYAFVDVFTTATAEKVCTLHDLSVLLNVVADLSFLAF